MTTKQLQGSKEKPLVFTSIFLAERAGGECDILIAGRSDGSIVLWRLSESNKTAGRGGTSREYRDELLGGHHPHRGMVNCIVYSEHTSFAHGSRGLLFSGSSDRTIKVWDVWARTEEDVIIQTIVGHGSTITALVDGRDGSVISASTDSTIRVWRPESGRELLMHPFFMCVECIEHGRSRPSAPADAWANSLVLNRTEPWSLYVGDALGSIVVYQQRRQDGTGAGPPTAASPKHNKPAPRSDSVADLQTAGGASIVLARHWEHVHNLGITDLVLVAEQNLLVSLSYDNTCAVVDAVSGSVFLHITNTHHTRYTGAAWDRAFDELVICDTQGHLEVWNTTSERHLARKQIVRRLCETPRRCRARGSALSMPRAPHPF